MTTVTRGNRKQRGWNTNIKTFLRLHLNNAGTYRKLNQETFCCVIVFLNTKVVNRISISGYLWRYFSRGRSASYAKRQHWRSNENFWCTTMSTVFDIFLFVSVHKHKRLEHIKAFCFDSSEIQCNTMYNIMCTSVLSSQYEVIDKLLYFFYNCCESYIRLMEEDKAVDTICFLVISRKCRISWSAFIFIIRASIFPFLSNQLCPIIWE